MNHEIEMDYDYRGVGSGDIDGWIIMFFRRRAKQQHVDWQHHVNRHQYQQCHIDKYKYQQRYVYKHQYPAGTLHAG